MRDLLVEARQVSGTCDWLGMPCQAALLRRLANALEQAGRERGRLAEDVSRGSDWADGPATVLLVLELGPDPSPDLAAILAVYDAHAESKEAR